MCEQVYILVSPSPDLGTLEEAYRSVRRADAFLSLQGPPTTRTGMVADQKVRLILSPPG